VQISGPERAADLVFGRGDLLSRSSIGPDFGPLDVAGPSGGCGSGMVHE